MPVRRSLIPLAPYRIGTGLALALSVAGCSDIIGPHPTVVPQPAAQEPHFLRWAGPVPPQFTAIDPHSGRVLDGLLLASTSSELGLYEYTVTFWAVAGEQRSIEIDYQSAYGDTSSTFLQLANIDPTYTADGGALALGDSVPITVTVGLYDMTVSLESGGVLLDAAAQLQISYGGAGGDLNGDGVVDDADTLIESQLLGISVRATADSWWTTTSTTQSLLEKSFTTALRYSQYAVSW